MHEFINKEWYVYCRKAPFNELSQKLGIDPVTVRIIRNRGMDTEEKMRQYLYGGLADLYDADLLPDIGPAADTVINAVRHGDRIRVAGDYDVDGVCAAYILCDGLKLIGAKVDHVIPDRVKDGYGINMSIVEKAHSDGIGLILTCDNGIAALSELDAAEKLGMKVVITDHHDIRRDENGKELLPPADHIVNAKLDASGYPEKEICGAVTAWKLLRVIFDKEGIAAEKWEKYLEFAALATICDVMKLTGENRIIAKEGLEKISRNPENRGLKALLDVNGLYGKPVTCFHAGFVLGPCINAGGRLETAEKAFSLFMAKTDEEACDKAAALKELNDNRKYLTQKGAEAAFAEVSEKYRNDRILLVYLPGLHESMAGIVAGRMKEKFGRPSFVITDSETGAADENGKERRLLKGSGRSVESYNMFEGLRASDALLYKYGGHPMAAGLSLFPENLDALRKELNRSCCLTEEDLKQKLWIDAPMPMRYVTYQLIKEFERLEPFGSGNEKPVFAEKNVRIRNIRVMGKNRNVLRMDLLSQNGQVFEGIMFCEADMMKKELEGRDTVSIAYYPQKNEYNGRSSLQMQIVDIR